MGTIAKGEITLSSVNDAYTVLLTPSSCSISAEFDGSNPALSNAKGSIAIYRGNKSIPFTIEKISFSNDDIRISITSQTEKLVKFVISHLPNTILDGNIIFKLVTNDGLNYSTEVIFSFNIVRESSMLDWIKDWENNKTSIGDSYVITPKIFVGKRIEGEHNSLLEVPDLTGVYIGPTENDGTGVYGYKFGKEIFHIDQTGGKIGGWDIAENAIQCDDGTLTIKSEGTISSQSEGIVHWSLNKDGSAYFANGKVSMDTEGNATFDGKIISSSGTIGGWNISDDALWIGKKNNTTGQFSPDIYSITIGNQGIRGYKFRFEKNGAGSIAGGNISWDENGKVTFSEEVSLSWSEGLKDINDRLTKIDANGIYTGNIDASQITAGYIKSDRLDAQSIKTNIINTQYINGLTCTFVQGSIGGWIIHKDSIQKDSVSLGANGDINCITQGSVSWNIDHYGNALFSKGKIKFNADGSGFLANGNIKWNADGSGFLANGNIKWNADGSGSLANGHISWNTKGDIMFSSSVDKIWNDKISNRPTVEDIKSQFTMDSSGISMLGKKISFNGVITFSSLNDDTQKKINEALEGKIEFDRLGTTIIDGGKIKSDLIQVDEAFVNRLFTNTITANNFNLNGGTIGGFNISNQHIGITNDNTTDGRQEGMFLYNDMIGFNGKDKQVIVGTDWFIGNYLARFVNKENVSGYNCGIFFDIKNNMYNQNYAFMGSGNGFLYGAVVGYKLSWIAFTQERQVYVMRLASGIYSEVCSPFPNCIVMLPSLTSLRTDLGIDKSDTRDLAVRLTLAKRTGHEVLISGRKDITVEGVSFNTDDYPYLRDNGFGNTEHWGFNNGDVIEVLLTYSAGEYNAYTVTLNR